jgi:MFS family permease
MRLIHEGRVAQTGDYEFNRQERPFMPGSPATPEHPTARRIAYAAIGVLIALTSGLSNGLLIANLPQIQGALGITNVEGGWLMAAYSITNVCSGFLLIKARQQFGLQRITRIFLLGFVGLTGAQVLTHTYGTELVIRAAAGIIASGFTPLGFFYLMQAMSAKARLSGMIIGVGLTQVALPLARAISPLLLTHGDVQILYVFEFALALLCLGAIALLPLPPSERLTVFEPLDFLTVALFAPGMALLTAVLVQGRIIWWTTPWLGYAVAGAILLIGAAMLIEHNRANPLLNTRWMGNRAVLRFAAIAAVMRILLGEQTYGSVGLLTVVGMGPDQLVTFYAIMAAATVAGLAVSIKMLNPQDLLRPVVISVALIAIAAFMDADASNLTRPANLYLTQAVIAFAAILFLGPTMMGGLLKAISQGPAHMVSFSAVFGISQTLGGLAGSALLGSFQLIRERFHSSELVQQMVMTDPQVAARIQQLGGAYGRVIGDPLLRQAQGGSLLAQQVTREANILAFNDVFLLIAVLACLALLWLGGRWVYLRVNGINPFAEDLAALQRMMANR